jgi:hypothetical protein
MGLKELTYDTAAFQLPDNEMTKYTPEELLDLMARISYDYWHAIGEMRKIAKSKLIMEAKLTAVIQSKNWEMLQNKLAKQLFKEACSDPKGFKPTVDFTKSIIYMEQQGIMEAYNFWEAEADAAVKYHQMLTNQLMWHQTENRRLTAELMALPSQPG